MNPLQIALAVEAALALAAQLQAAYNASKVAAPPSPAELAAADARVDAAHARYQQALATGIDPGPGPSA